MLLSVRCLGGCTVVPTDWTKVEEGNSSRVSKFFICLLCTSDDFELRLHSISNSSVLLSFPFCSHLVLSMLLWCRHRRRTLLQVFHLSSLLLCLPYFRHLSHHILIFTAITNETLLTIVVPAVFTISEVSYNDFGRSTLTTAMIIYQQTKDQGRKRECLEWKWQTIGREGRPKRGYSWTSGQTWPNEDKTAWPLHTECKRHEGDGKEGQQW